MHFNPNLTIMKVSAQHLCSSPIVGHFHASEDMATLIWQ
jgi:hypothetical protein